MKNNAVMAIVLLLMWLPLRANLNRALYLKDKGALKEAEESITHIITDKPDDAQALQALGIVKYRQGDFASAKTYFQDAVRFASTESFKEQALYNLARAQAELKEYEESISSFQQALEINPDNEQARHNKEMVEELFAIQKLQEKMEKERQAENHQPNEEKEDHQQPLNRCQDGKVDDKKTECYTKDPKGDTQGWTEEERACQDETQGGEEDNGNSNNNTNKDGSSSLKKGEQKSYHQAEDQQGQEHPDGQESKQRGYNDKGQGEQKQNGAAACSQQQGTQSAYDGQQKGEKHQAYNAEKDSQQEKHMAPMANLVDATEDEHIMDEQEMESFVTGALENDERLTDDDKKVLACVEVLEQEAHKSLICHELKYLPRNHGQKNW